MRWKTMWPRRTSPETQGDLRRRDRDLDPAPARVDQLPSQAAAFAAMVFGFARRGPFGTIGPAARSILPQRRTADTADEALVAFVDELRRIRGIVGDLLDGDDRDTDEIPEFAALADRHMALAAAVSRTPARTRAGLLAKARAVDPRDAATLSEVAVTVALSLAADLVAVEH